MNNGVDTQICVFNNDIQFHILLEHVQNQQKTWAIIESYLHKGAYVMTCFTIEPNSFAIFAMVMSR